MCPIVLPDGTFMATCVFVTKTSKIQPVSSVRPWLLPVVLAGALSAGVAGCGTAASTDGATSAAATSSSTSSGAATSKGSGNSGSGAAKKAKVRGLKPVIDKEDFSGTSAAADFGLANVQDGYDFVAHLTAKSHVRPAPGQHAREGHHEEGLRRRPRRDDPVRPEGLRQGLRQGRRYLGTEKGMTDLSGVAYYGFAGKGWTIRKDIPATGIRIHDTAAFPTNNGHLGIRSHVECTAHYVHKDGSKVKQNCDRVQTYYLRKVDGQWRLDGWNVTYGNWKNTPETL